MKKSRFLSLLLTLVMLMSMTGLAAEAAEGGKYTTETTTDGWIKVVNDGGATLGYSPDTGVTIIEDDGYAFKDLNRNGTLDAYEDWRLDAQARAENLANLLPLEQIAGLMMLQGDNASATGQITEATTDLINKGMRIVFKQTGPTLVETVAYNNEAQALVEAENFGIPFLYDSHREFDFSMEGLFTKFPTRANMASTFDAELMAESAEIVAKEMRAMGMYTTEDPQIDLCTEPRWRRITEAFTEDPALGTDMAVAYANALQSTYDEDGVDLGWGEDSVLVMLKHFPGDGAAEGGRESHDDYGAYNVLRGDNLYTQLMPFAACMDLPGETKQAAMVMPSYSITLDEDGNALGDERVGSSYSHYKVTELLREELGFEGSTITDYGIVDSESGHGRSNGMRDKTPAEQIVQIIYAGNDLIGSYSNLDVMLEAIELYKAQYGEEEADARFRLSAKRLLKNFFQVGVFENPYLDYEESAAVIYNEEYDEFAMELQKKSVVMLKNSTGIIREADADAGKQTVYIPLVYKTTQGSGLMEKEVAPYFGLSMDTEVLKSYFNIVTDTVGDPTGPADENGNATYTSSDVIRASAEDISKCDFAIVCIQSPQNAGSNGGGYDAEAEAYIPISLQYQPYTANSVYVNQQSLGGDLQTVEVQDTYGAQMVITTENRSYYGKTSQITNESDLDLVLEISEICDNVVVVVSADNPMVFDEFEDKVETILYFFTGQWGDSVSNQAVCEILAGKFEPSGLLTYQMPANMETVEAQYEDVPRDMECHVDTDGNTYDFAFGLDWDGVIQDERVEKYNVDPLIG